MRVGLIWILLVGSCLGAVPIERAKEAMDALNRAYWDPTDRCFRKTPGADSKPLDFWMTAHVWECVMDAYERHRDRDYKEQIGDVYDGFVAAHPDWSTNPYNDDIMWWTIACVRAYHVTGRQRYLYKATSEFDRLYEREVDTRLGGGMWWKSDSHRSKNACVNGPAAITAMELALARKDNAYAEKACDLYKWERATLFDPDTGVVNDNINRRGRVTHWRFTYNQGTFIGAALRLYRHTGQIQYLDDAILAGKFMRERLVTSDGILKSEGQGDGGTFKLIGVRYMVELAEVTKDQGLLDWLDKNAQTAWRNRRTSDNIMGFDWSRPVKDDEVIECQSAAAAVVLLNLLR